MKPPPPILPARGSVTASAGTEGYGRLTADLNQVFGDNAAIRVNAMKTDAGSTRDHVESEREGVEPTLRWGIGTANEFSLGHYYLRTHNTLDFGVPFFDRRPLDVPGNRFYGTTSDYEDNETHISTASWQHRFSRDLDLRTVLRHAEYTRDLWGTVPRLPAGTTVITPTSPINRGRQARGGEEATLTSQTDLSARFTTGAVEHSLVAGVSFSKEDYDLDSGSVFRNADGSALPNTNAVYPLQDLHAPYNIWTGPVHYVLTGRNKASVNNQAIYAFDTLRFGERWLLNLGARYEHNEGDSVTLPVAGSTATYQKFENEDDLFSWRAGLVFKPTGNGSVYLSYASSATPSKASVNASCTAATCNVDPEEARNLELGTKWEVFDRHLSLSAAVFRNERTNYRLPDPDPANVAGVQVLDGRSRVDGLALGAAGRITDQWSIFANYTWLDSELEQSVSNFCLANPGATGCNNSAADPDPGKGDPLPNVPEHSASLWTTYALSAWTFGYGATYQGAFHPTAANAASDIETSSYVVHNAMVGYQLNERFGLQLNLRNLTDKLYFHSIRNNASNGWAIPGDGRSAVLTATFRF